MAKKLQAVWNTYYSQRGETALQDRNFFELEISALKKEAKKYFGNKTTRINILEIGCGTGYLAKHIIPLSKQIHYTGVDFSDVAIKKARGRNLKHAQFIASNFIDFLKTKHHEYDIILSQRSVIAAVSKKQQLTLLRCIKQAKKKGGIGIFSEIIKESFETLNKLRRELKLPPIKKVWHSRHLRKEELRKMFKSVAIRDFASTYWLITRVIYPYFRKPVHNSPLAKFAVGLDQTGKYSPVKLIIAK